MRTVTVSTIKQEVAAFWMSVEGLRSGETVKLAGGLSYVHANKLADTEAENLAARGNPIEWSRERRHV